jgi:hypothetical protein
MPPYPSSRLAQGGAAEFGIVVSYNDLLIHD